MTEQQEQVLRRHRMMREGLVATLTKIQDTEGQYRIEVTKEMAGLHKVVKSGAISAASNRIAIKKMKQWLDKRFPVKDTPQQTDRKREQLESLFK